MHLTVKQAMTIYPLSEGKLIAGAAGAARVVKSVNVMDAPDIGDWIKEGEMLFTTAYLMKDSVDESIRLLRLLNEKGSAGLGIKLGRFLDEVPEEMKREADRMAFPLIELPYRFTFSDQMNGLFQAELNRSTEGLRSVVGKQKQLMRFALTTDPIRKLFDSIASIIGHPMAVIDSSGKPVYNNTAYMEASLVGGWPWKPHHQWVHIEGAGCIRIPLLRSGECSGFVLFVPEEALFKAEEGLFHQAAELLAHHMPMAETDYGDPAGRDDFGAAIRCYLNGEGSPAEVLQAARRLERNPLQAAYVCVMLSVVPPESRLRTGKAANQAEKRFLPECVRSGSAHVALPEGLLTICEMHEGKAESELADWIRSGAASWNGMPPGARLAVSLPKRSPEALKDAYEECAEALRLAELLGMNERIVSYDRVELAALFQYVPKERMNRFCEGLLGGLTSKDPEYAREMLRTLEVFVENDGQVNETAKKLYIHRNTATYRMEKMSELLQLDLKRMNDLLRLKLAFQFRRLLGAERSAVGRSSVV